MKNFWGIYCYIKEKCIFSPMIWEEIFSYVMGLKIFSFLSIRKNKILKLVFE